MISRRYLRKTLLLAGLLVLLAGPAHSGVVLDGTLGTRGRLTGPDYDILSRFGRIVGSNLFHSFLNFDIGTGETANFSGPASIANIIARVTGGDASAIDGLLRSDISGANLYLINPNGIVFGQNASLDISGSFYASTADYLRLGSSGRFDVANPAASVLTSDPPSAFGFLSATPAGIDIRNARLAVEPGKSLNFIAGSLTISGDGVAPTLATQGGNINLIAGGSGEVLFGAGRPVNNLGTDGDITISGDWTGDAPLIDASNPTGAGGRIYISGGRFLLANAGIVSVSNGAQQGGGIVIEGSDVALDSGWLTTSTAGGGNAGNILIDADAIRIGGDSQVGSWAADPATGNAGNVTLHADGDILIDGASWIFNSTYGDGNAGNILIDGNSVHLGENCTVSSNSADAWSDALADGDAGDITIRATGQVLIDGDAWVMSQAYDEGDAGNITIKAGTFSLLGYSYLSSYTNYHGNAGNVLITADTIHIGDQAYIESGALDDVWGYGVTGNAGNITLLGRDRVDIDGSAYLRSDTQGSGNAGNILIDAGTVHIGGASYVSSEATFWSSGRAGDITLNADNAVLIDGDARISSETSGDGDSGNIAITAGSIHIGDYSKVSSSAFLSNSGNAGNITLRAHDEILIDGGAGVSSEALLGGNAGDLLIEAGSIHIGGDSLVSSSALIAANAGDITLRATDQVLIDGSAWVQSESYGAINAGNILIEGASIHIGGDSWVSSSTYGDGNAGNITLIADNGVLIDGNAWVFSETNGEGAAGNISANADSIHIGGDTWVSSSSFDAGNAGNVALNAGNVSIDETAWIESAAYSYGNAGNILINADKIHIGGNSFVYTSSFDTGNAGSILLNASDELLIDGTAGVESEARDTGNAGSITIKAGEFSLKDIARVSTNTRGEGDAGSILVDVDGLTEIDGGSISSSTSGAGAGGSVIVRSDSLTLSDNGRLSATSTGIGSGTAGNITVDVDDNLIMTSGGTIETSTEDADGGDIQVTVGRLLWMRDSSITTSVRGGTGNGGNITLEGGAIVLDDSSITANAYGGNGGNITITADPLLMDENSRITASSQLGVQGTIGINAPLVDVGGSLADLPEGMLTDDLAPQTCSTVGDNASSFVVRNVTPAKRRDDSFSF
jgi:filamentous hemagglutinin family protein